MFIGYATARVGHQRFGERLFERRHAILYGRLGDHERRTDLHRSAAESHRAEHQHALFDRPPHHLPGEIRIRLFGARNHAGECPPPGPCRLPMPICGVRAWSACSFWCKTAPILRAFSARFSLSTRSIDASAAAQQTRIAGVRGGHAAGRVQIHHVRAVRPRPRGAANWRCLCRNRPGRARCRNARSPTACRCGRSPACTSSHTSSALWPVHHSRSSRI